MAIDPAELEKALVFLPTSWTEPGDRKQDVAGKDGVCGGGLEPEGRPMIRSIRSFLHWFRLRLGLFCWKNYAQIAPTVRGGWLFEWLDYPGGGVFDGKCSRRSVIRRIRRCVRRGERP